MRTLKVMCVMMVALVISSQALAGQRMRHARTAQGVRSGELTVQEARRVRAGERRIDRAQIRARADGEVTSEERSEIMQRKQNQSQRIFRLKHNDKEQSGIQQ